MITDGETKFTKVVLQIISVIWAKLILETFWWVILLEPLQDLIPLTFSSVSNVCVDDGLSYSSSQAL